MPKLYFFDTGQACNLLGLEHPEQLLTNHMRGEIFENLIISELIKFRLNKGLQPNAYFWRDNKGLEIDCLFETIDKLIPIEIKSGLTPNLDFFRNFKRWNKISGTKAENNVVVYAGETTQELKEGILLSWQDISNLIVK